MKRSPSRSARPRSLGALAVSALLALALAGPLAPRADASRIPDGVFAKIDPLLRIAYETLTADSASFAKQWIEAEAESRTKGTIDLSLARDYRALRDREFESMAQVVELGRVESTTYADVLVLTDGSRPSLESFGGEVRSTIGDVSTARVPLDRLPEIAAMPQIRYVQASTFLQAANDSVNAAIRAGAARSTFGATGIGVLVGIVDTGIDYTHASFGGEGTVGAYEANDPT
ncbi:MAG: hypothetical protein EHM19_13130, partial [Candidatus Latescibacterota bacterium]